MPGSAAASVGVGWDQESYRPASAVASVGVESLGRTSGGQKSHLSGSVDSAAVRVRLDANLSHCGQWHPLTAWDPPPATALSGTCGGGHHPSHADRAGHDAAVTAGRAVADQLVHPKTQVVHSQSSCPQLAVEPPIWGLTRVDLKAGRPREWWGLPTRGGESTRLASDLGWWGGRPFFGKTQVKMLAVVAAGTARISCGRRSITRCWAHCELLSQSFARVWCGMYLTCWDSPTEVADV